MTDATQVNSRPQPFWIRQRLILRGKLERWAPVAHYYPLLGDLLDQTEGPLASERRLFPSPEEATAHIKSLAADVGADLVGITRLRSHHQLADHDDPLPFAICLGMAMSLEEIRQAPGVPAGLEVMRVYYELGRTTLAVGQHLRSLGWRANIYLPLVEGAHPAQLLYVPIAIDAGLAELGRCGYAISPVLGPLFRLGVVTTELPLSSDEPRPFGVDQFCQLCSACRRACPGRAIAAEKTRVRGIPKWQLDAEACFPYFADYLGCSICLAVCPYSLPHARANLVSRWARQQGIGHPLGET